MLALLLACRLRRHEAVALTLDHLQQREECWAIVGLVGKGGHIRTVPVPDWVRPNWTIGSPQPQLIEEDCSAGSTRWEGHGEMG
jgi:hypothetical protein